MGLDAIPQDSQRIVFAVTSYSKGKDFDDVHDAYIRLVDDRPGEYHDVELCRYELDPSAFGVDVEGLIFAAIHRCRGGGWNIEALGLPVVGKAGKTPTAIAKIVG